MSQTQLINRTTRSLETILLLLFDLYGIFFLIQLLWIGLWVLHWIKIMRVRFIILFLILEKKFLAFHNQVCCYLWVCHTWPLLYWGVFLLHLTSWEVFYRERMPNFVKWFFSIYWDNHTIFIIHFVNVVYQVYRSVCIEAFFNLRGKSHLVLVYNLFKVFLNLFS